MSYMITVSALCGKQGGRERGASSREQGAKFEERLGAGDEVSVASWSQTRVREE